MVKDHIYVWELSPGSLHENRRGIFGLAIGRAGKEGVRLMDPKEGRVNLIARNFRPFKKLMFLSAGKKINSIGK